MAPSLHCKPCALPPWTEANNRDCLKLQVPYIPNSIGKVSRPPTLSCSRQYWPKKPAIAKLYGQPVTTSGGGYFLEGRISNSCQLYFHRGFPSSTGVGRTRRYTYVAAARHDLIDSTDALDEFDQQIHDFSDQQNELSLMPTREDREGGAEDSKGVGYSAFKGEVMERIKDLGEFMDQLDDLQTKVESMIEKGDEETAMDLVEANYEALMEQIDQGIEGVEQAAMLDILIQLSMSLQDLEAAEQMLNQMRDVLSKVELHEPLVDVLFEHMGNVYLDLGYKEDALFCYTRSLNIQESVLGKNSPHLYSTLLGLAATYNDLGQREKGIDIYKHIIFIVENSKGTSSEDLVAPLLHLGHTLLEEKNADDAELYMQRALRLAQEMDSKSGVGIGVTTCALARVKCSKGEYNKAIELFQKGLDILNTSSCFSKQDPIMENIRTEVAEFMTLVGRKKEAQELWEENLREKEKLVGPSSPRLVVHLQNLATSYAHDEKFDKCEPLLRRSLKLITTSLGPLAPQVSVPLEFLATALHHLGNQVEAEALARQALSIRENNYPMEHPLIGEACNILASILHSRGKNDEALTLAQRVLHIKEKQLGKNNLGLGGILDLLIEIMHSLGRTEETLPLINRVEGLISTREKAAA